MIKNAQIVGDNIPPERYNVEEKPRGNPELMVRSHVLTEVLRNAQRWVRGYESPETKSRKWGSLWDCFLFTPRQYRGRYAVVPEDAPRKPSKTQVNAEKPSAKTIAAIEWWDHFKKENPGEIIDSDQDQSVREAVARLREDKLIAELIDCSARQVMIVAEWHDPGTGLVVPMKCLIDLVPDPQHALLSNSVWDGKTTMNASPRSFSRDAQKYGYGIQGALYLDLYNAATGDTRSDFGHVVQENYRPYEYRTPPPLLSQRFLGHGRLMYQKALGIYCRALQSGVWPGYDAGVKGWPITDCDDWLLSADTLYDTFEEPEPEATKAPEDDFTP